VRRSKYMLNELSGFGFDVWILRILLFEEE
jgi:hypothetical protein